MESALWTFFAEYWLLIFWAIIGAAFLVIGVLKLIDEIRFRLERRRYQLARK